MSATANKAVFLSYASQDAEAARRICDALRAAGVEVWFDQSELRGGDAWDGKIRKQIKDCALFIPIVSANTQARREGYFRLEWKLADDRTHLMAKGTPFLVPVCIDDTKDWDAVVPDAFMAVQWTRLAGGEGAAAFGERVRTLLAGAALEPGRPRPGERDEGAASPKKAARMWLGLAVAAALALVALVIWRPWTTRVAAPAPRTEAQQVVEKARQVLERGDELNRENYLLAEDLVKRAVALDPTEASAWDLHARISYFMVWHSVDNSEVRRDAMRRQAERARALAPASPEVQLTAADVRTALREDLPAIAREMEEMARRDPTNWRVQRALGNAYRFMRRPDAALDALRRARELADGSVTTSADLVNLLMRTDRHPEAEAVMREALSRRPAARLLTSDMVLRTSWRGDLAGAAAALEQWPDWLRAEDRGAVLAWRTWFWSEQYDKALAAIQRVPRDYLRDVFFVGPRAVLTARAHESAGHLDAARVDWQTVVQLTDRELAASPDAVPALYWKAWAIARLGDLPGAQAIAGQMEQRNQFRFDRDALGILNSGTKALYFGVPGAVALWTTVGRTDRALAALTAAFTAVDQFALTRATLELDPAFAPLRNEPAFRELLAKASAPSDRRGGSVEIAPKSAPADKSVAVLAFANRSDDATNEIFSDGISEELINLLGRVPGLTVKGRSSSFYFKGRDATAQEKGHRLGATYLVDGSVRKSGNSVRITAQLIRAATDEVVWSSEPITKELKDVLTVQEEIAGMIAQNLQLKLGAPSRPARAVNPEAHRLVLEGRHFWGLRTEDGFTRAEAAFRNARDLDPEFAPAHAGLALVQATRVAYAAYLGETRRTPELLWTAARRALELDPGLAEGYAALAYGFFNEGRAADSGREYQKALALNPNSALLHHWYSLTLENAGRLDEALAEITQATALDPLSGIALVTRERMAMAAGRYPEALELHERVAGLLPELEAAFGVRAISLLQLGRAEEAAGTARLVSPQSSLNRRVNADAQVVHILRQTGHAAEAATHAAQIMPRFRADSYQRGFVLAAQGRWEEAVPFLERTPQTLRYLFFWDPTWDAVRGDPKFAQLMAKLGCTEEYRVARAALARMAQERATRK